ncbi:hypothetical protein LZ32DRAFT_91799 [Colletotrichum eremochloae]|nr:hypothetical protein LZ32DRAFT_91799 [Colletotrichum eremochloae]
MNCHPDHLLYRTLEFSFRRGDDIIISARHPNLLYFTLAGTYGASPDVTEWIESNEKAANLMRKHSREQGIEVKTLSGNYLDGILSLRWTSPWRRFADVFLTLPSHSGFMATASFGGPRAEVTVHMSPSGFPVGTAKLQDSNSGIYSIEFDFTEGFESFDYNHSILVFQSSNKSTECIISQMLQSSPPVNVTCGAPADQLGLAGKIETGAPIQTAGQTTVETNLMCPEFDCHGRLFENEKSLRAHKGSHREFLCSRQECSHSKKGNGFKRKKGLQDHELSHNSNHDKSSHKCPIEGCPRSKKGFDRARLLQLHHRNVHKEFSCRFAGCNFTGTNSQLYKHVMQGHEMNRLFICHHDGCRFASSGFTDKELLRAHLKNFHKD